MRARLLAAVCVFALAGCIVEAPGSDSPNGTRRQAVAAAPAMQVRSGANFENKVQLLGAKVEPGRALPGDAVKVTAYFKVLQRIPADYMIFVHLEDPGGQMQRMNADHQPAQGQYPTSQWKPGETVSDSFSFYVPAGQGVKNIELWMGFWHPQTDARLTLSNPDQVRNDGSNRILLASIPVGVAN